MAMMDLPNPVAHNPDYLKLVALPTSLGYGHCSPYSFHPEYMLRVIICIISGSADGHGMHAFFFVDDKYLGTDSASASPTITYVSQDDTTVTLSYVVYKAGDPMCCATGGTAKVRFHWDGERLVALDPIPPGASF